MHFKREKTWDLHSFFGLHGDVFPLGKSILNGKTRGLRLFVALKFAFDT